MKLRLVTILLALVAVAQAGGGRLNACGSLPSIDVAGIQRRLNAAEALWRRVGPRQYQLQTTAQGGIGRYTVNLSVGREVVSGIMRAEQGQIAGQPVRLPIFSVNRAESARRYTVPGLFLQVQRLLDATSPARPCGTLNVTFDPKDGHLRSLQYDNAFSIDEEYSLSVSPVTGTP